MFSSIKRLRNLAALPVIGALALVVPMAAPAGATASQVIGAGLASGIVHGTTTPTTACTSGGGYVFQGVGIAGATLIDGSPSAGSTSVTSPSPAGQATGDPLDGTPLGCGAGNVWSTIAATAPAGTPVGCPVPTTGVTCGSGTGFSNILADEGSVKGAGSLAEFKCDAGSPIACRLSGTFLRFGGTVIVALTGEIEPGGSPLGVTNNADVVLAANVIPTVATPDSVFAGPYVITPKGTLSALNPALNKAYCPVGTHAGTGYPPLADCH